MNKTNNPMPFTKREVKELKSNLVEPTINIAFDTDNLKNDNPKLYKKLNIPDDGTEIYIDQLDFPITSLDHLYEQIFEKNRKIGKHDEESE